MYAVLLRRDRLLILTDAISFDHADKYTAVGPFEYAGP